MFNILEERDIQIRGYPIRFPLDVVLVFSANPEEYSRSGKIISQLKDRIGSEIRTHYPITREAGLRIVDQEAMIDVGDGYELCVPDFMKEIIEQITMEARHSPHVNQKSGVSARLSISNYETLVANARRRALMLKERRISPRVSDLNYLYTSSLGKIELDPFREESLTDYQAVSRIVDRAVLKVFTERIDNGKLDELTEAVTGAVTIETGDMIPSSTYKEIFTKAPQLWEPVHALGGDASDEMRASCVEFVLEGLFLSGKLSRKKVGELATYRGKGGI